MGVIAKYKFNQELYANFIPEFNAEFTVYTVTDEIDTDGYTIRTIESDNLPTLIRFGSNDTSGNGDYTKQYSLLEVNELNTDNVGSMSSMFYQCKNLTQINTNFNTSNVTNMQAMFSNCSSLTSLDVSNFNTEKVATMQNMFQNCSLLTSLDISNFKTENVTIMSGMFYGCSKLTSLNVSNFNTENVTAMQYMFFNCSSLTSLDISNFNTEKVTSMGWMFQGCSSLISLNLSNFNTKNVTNMQETFHNCSSLTSLDISNFNTEKVTSMGWMFQGCSSLISLDVSNFNTKNVTNTGGMFYACSSLTSLDISSFNTEKVATMQNMFQNCSSLISLDVSNFSTQNVTSMNYMFNNCYDLTSVGAIYCDIDTINEISNLITTDTTIWYTDINLDDLTEKQNITYKEYKMNILECDEEIELRSNGDVCDELNLLTGELTQRIDENGEILVQEIIKTINLKNKPSINWQGDTYLHLENNILYPQLDCEVESINYYEVPKLKANTLYTLRYVGEPTQCIFGGLTYETENNMILTSGSSDNLLYFDKEVRKVILIEGDVRDRNFDYFEGIESLGAVEVITHKTNMPIFAKGGRK